MRKLTLRLIALAFVSLMFYSCTPESINNEKQAVDKTKIKRPGDQGGGGN